MVIEGQCARLSRELGSYEMWAGGENWASRRDLGYNKDGLKKTPIINLTENKMSSKSNQTKTAKDPNKNVDLKFKLQIQVCNHDIGS